MEIEQWKQIVIDNIEYHYEVSNMGNIRNIENGRLLKPYMTSKGYLQVRLYKGNKIKNMYVHRLVGLMFISNDDIKYKTEINHVNEIKTDNRVDNLEWCTRSYNCNYGSRTERQAKANSKKVMAISTTENKVLVFQSITQAEKLGFKRSNICTCCQGILKIYKGYKWRYID